MFSLRTIADNIVPKTGIKKLKTEITPTLLYFKSCDHSAKATEDNNAIYINNVVDLKVKFVRFPPVKYPINIKATPPIVN